MLGTETDATRPLPAAPRVRDLVAGADRFTVALWSIAVVQAAWLAVLLSRGWYYQADFSNLIDGRTSLSMSYLTESQGGHLAIGDRLAYWVMYRTMPLNFAATVTIRILLQAAMTLLLARLLVLLVGRRPGVLAITLLYALSPLSIQTWQWVTASVAFLPSQIFVLLALHAHVRYALTRRLVWAVITALCLFASVIFSEQAVIIALALPLLSLGYLHAGSARERVRALLGCWPEWALIAAPMMLFLAYYFGSGKFVKSDSTGLTLGQAARVVGDEFWASLLPAIVGGPLRWLGADNNFLSIADPAGWLQFLGAAFAVTLVVLSVRRTGWRALIAWAIPVLVLVTGIVVVAIGRYAQLGMMITRQFEHTGYVAIPLAMAVALAFWAGSPAQIETRLPDGGMRHPAAAGRRMTDATPDRHRYGRRTWTTVGVVTVIAAASIASQLTYTQHWADNPARSYVQRLDRDLQRLGRVSLYDTPVNSIVIPIISPNHYVSDLVALLGRSVKFNTPGRLMIVASDGSVRPSRLLVAASGVQEASAGCAVIVRGAGDWRIPLDHVPHASEYFLHMSYLQQHGAVVAITVEDSDGRRVVPVGGDRTELLGTLSTLTRRLPLMQPAAVLVHSNSLATNLCLSDVVIGAPFPVQK